MRKGVWVEVTGRLARALAVAALVCGCATPGPSTLPGATTVAASRTAGPSEPTVSPSPTFAPISTDGTLAVVARVVDGDTIHATVRGTDEKVRIIGLDSPETSKPGTPVECFARESTVFAESLLPVGALIRLQADPTQDARDRYGRLLAHVVLSDGRLFAEIMIWNGDAIHYVYDGVPSMYADRLAAAQAHAQASGAGIWSATTCDGNDHAESAAP